MIKKQENESNSKRNLTHVFLSRMKALQKISYKLKNLN